MSASAAARQRALVGLLALSGLFIAALVTCNLIATKFTRLDLGFYVFTVSVGILPYPLTFLITDVISEIYGRRRANQVVLSGLLASIMVAGFLALTLPFEAIEDSVASTREYAAVFGMGWRVILASMVAYLFAQLIDVRVFHFWKGVTDGKHLWFRNNASTILSQLVDTALVVTVLFVGVWEWGQIAATIRDGWFFKILCALLDTPLCYAAVWSYRRWLGLRGAEEASL